MARGGMDAVVARAEGRRRPVFKRKGGPEEGPGAKGGKGPALVVAIGEKPKADEGADAGSPDSPSLDDLAARIAALEARCDAYDAQHRDGDTGDTDDMGEDDEEMV